MSAPFNTPVTSMEVLARSKDAVYLRIPKDLQQLCTGGCDCPHCTVDPQAAAWDTLVVPTKAPRGKGNDFSSRCHLPDAAVPEFITYLAEKDRKKSKQ